MSDISVLGLGLMGAALARQLQRGGHQITLWNRSPEKMEPLLNESTRATTGIVEAVVASPVVLIGGAN